MQRIVKCDKCQQHFNQKWVGSQKNWSQINLVSYWTGGKNWNNYQLLCRACLNNWFEVERESFANLVTDRKKLRIFYSYRSAGTFDKKDWD